MDFNNDRPIYIQLLDRLQFLIVSGNIKLGERIPSVRDLAFEYKINPNTVQKALQELENIGLIYTERTNGKFVTDDKKLIEKYKSSLAKEHIQNYFENMYQLGFNKEEALDYLKGDKL
ncbi:MAG: GntR family transcriptional regulator [Bacilli bacterium]|nr:GntR family transcriptional regulator [Bacilli bacterium]